MISMLPYMCHAHLITNTNINTKGKFIFKNSGYLGRASINKQVNVKVLNFRYFIWIFLKFNDSQMKYQIKITRIEC